MKQNIQEKIEIPEEVELEINGGGIKVSSNGREIIKRINLKNIKIKKEGKTLILESENAGKRESKMLHTAKAHIKNMIKGVKENFVYNLEIAFVHFPMNVEIKGENLIIKNFLGEKKSRTCRILPGTEVKISGKLITVQSHNKEFAGQMAANIEKATKTRNKDKRKFQDGIYITEKPGRII